MDLKARPVEPITDRAMTHETFKKLGSTSNSRIDLRMFNATLFGKNERKETRQPGLIKSTIATQSSMNLAPVCDLPGVPAFAELSTLAAGMIEMPFRKFCYVMLLSNIGVAVIFSGLGAAALSNQSSTIAFFGVAILPAFLYLTYKKYIKK